MYRILCYGDSNTWGFNPVNGLRFSETERWPGILKKNLGTGFEVIEDGLNGRRILNSLESFETAINENNPLDVIIIFLGLNDICFDKDTRVRDILDGIEEMLMFIRNLYRDFSEASPEIILIGAVPINETQIEDCLYQIEAEKVRKFGEGLRLLAECEGCGYINPGKIIQTSSLDGIHLEVSEHRKLGLFVADYARTFLTNVNLRSGRNL